MLNTRGSFALLKQNIVDFDWNCKLQGSLDEASELFTFTFLNFVKQCIPSKIVTIREDDKPWYDSEMRSSSRKREKQKRTVIKTGISNDWHEYRKTQKLSKQFKETCQRTFFKTI